MNCPRCGAHIHVGPISHLEDSPDGLRAVSSLPRPARTAACPHGHVTVHIAPAAPAHHPGQLTLLEGAA